MTPIPKKKIENIHKDSKNVLNLCISKWDDAIGYILENKGIKKEEVVRIANPNTEVTIQDIYKIEHIIKELFNILNKKKISKDEIIFAKKAIERGMLNAHNYGEINSRKNWRFI